MSCYRPLDAWRHPNGSIQFKATHSAKIANLKLPCGQCVGCRIDRSREWAVRCTHEASLHKENCFLTLTYAETEDNPSLDHRDFQLFMKSLRKKAGKKLTYYMCGEYGQDQEDVKNGVKKPRLGRKHYHAIIFGYDFKDKKLWKITKQKERLYRSKTLEQLWKHGYSTTASVTWNSSAYVSRYIMKKQSGDYSEEHYRITNKTTGESIEVKPEYTQMSTKPGIGKKWLEKYWKDIYPSDQCLIKTKSGIKKFKVPRYYDELMEDQPATKTRKSRKGINPELIQKVKENRIENARKHRKNNTYERLEIREHIQQAKVHQLKRQLS